MRTVKQLYHVLLLSDGRFADTIAAWEDFASFLGRPVFRGDPVVNGRIQPLRFLTRIDKSIPDSVPATAFLRSCRIGCTTFSGIGTISVCGVLIGGRYVGRHANYRFDLYEGRDTTVATGLAPATLFLQYLDKVFSRKYSGIYVGYLDGRFP